MKKSWKTTAIACGMAVIVAVAPMFEQGSVNWKAVGMAALIAAFGFVSKDANVTGGTVSNIPDSEKKTS